MKLLRSFHKRVLCLADYQYMHTGMTHNDLRPERYKPLDTLSAGDTNIDARYQNTKNSWLKTRKKQKKLLSKGKPCGHPFVFAFPIPARQRTFYPPQQLQVKSQTYRGAWQQLRQCTLPRYATV